MINVKKTYLKNNEYYKEDYVDEKADNDNDNNNEKTYVKTNALQILLKYSNFSFISE